jgi:hypothetical protein
MKRKRPKGSKNKPKSAAEEIVLSLSRKDLEGIVQIHLDTGVGIPTLFKAACNYLAEGYVKDKKLGACISCFVNEAE